MKYLVVNKDYNLVYETTLSVLRLMECSIKESSSEKKYITANKKGSIMTYGETIEITFSILPSQTQISVQSFSKGIQILDWGTNDENEIAIINELKGALK